ncbi:MAG TPA: pyrroline-5-carboxylate reductase [Candidatus Omnitrophota bacterium]|nr:pyrroline-5-carboxylate reductase [Candidatus Omnitrophota bacterium]
MSFGRKIGFLGCGNMGSAILAGVLKARIASPREIAVFDVATRKLAGLRRRFRIQAACGEEDLARKSDVLVLAVKPQEFGTVADKVKKSLKPGTWVITVLAGVPIGRIRSALGNRLSVVRAMPNLGAFVGESMTVLTGGNAGHLKLASKIFSGCGKVIELPEKYFDLVTALSGSGPAYFFYLMELLVREGKRYGLSREAARFLAVQTAKGAALLAGRSDETLEALRLRVTSKGGTTESALRVMETKGMPGILRDAVKSAVNRARELGRR